MSTTQQYDNAVLDSMLAFDPLQAAEDLTGKSMHDDDAVGMLGMLIALKHSDIKVNQLLIMDDTTLINKVDRYIRIITIMGFEQVLDVPFDSPGWTATDPAYHEHFYAYAHRDGMLLTFDTHNEVNVNGGHLYYCWVANDTAPTGCTSSGGWYEREDGPDYWAGSHDCREALRRVIDKLRTNGTFLTQWPASNRMFLWLLHHRDTKKDGYDYETINQERITMLPDWVREMIGR